MTLIHAKLWSSARGVLWSAARCWGAAFVVTAAAISFGAEPPPPRLDEAIKLRVAGKLDEALEVLRVESREIRQAEGEESPRVVAVNVLAAEILLDKEQHATAEALITKTMTLHESLVKAEKISKDSLGPTILASARLNLALKRLPAAISSSCEALPLLDRLGGPRSPDRDRCCDILETAVDALAKLLGPADTMTLDARDRAATVLESIGRFNEAVHQRKEILAGLRARSDPAAMGAAEKLGQLMGMAGRAGEAVRILDADPAIAATKPRLLGNLQLADNQLLAAKRSLEAATEADKGSAKATATDNRLCQLLIEIRRGRVDAVPDWFDPSLKALAKTSAKESVWASGALITASEVLAALGQPSQGPLESAALLLKRLQPSVKKVRGRAAAAPAAVAPKDLAGPVADIAGRLAAARLTAGIIESVREEAEPALTAAAEALGPGDGRVAVLRVALAEASRAKGDFEAASAFAGKAIDYGLPRADDAQEEFLVTTYDRLAAEKDQKDWRAEFIAARVRQFGDKHPHVAMAWSLFGASRLAAGDWKTAAECLSKSLDLQRSALGDDHPEVAATLVLVAHASRLAGDTSAAVRTSADALTVWERIVGPNHPGTLEAVDVLASARLQAGERDGVPALLARLCAADGSADPVRRAYHLVRLAELTARKDKAAARANVQEAMKLPCWDSDEGLSVNQRTRLADTAAYAARAYRLMGDDAAGQMTLLKARSIAMRLDESGGLLPRIEKLAAP